MIFNLMIELFKISMFLGGAFAIIIVGLNILEKVLQVVTEISYFGIKIVAEIIDTVMGVK